MSRNEPRRQEVETLLRQPVEALPPRPGTWELIDRRATRRKWAKAGLSAAAAMIVIAGAVPAVLAVRHTSDNQTLAISNGKQLQRHAGSTPGPTPHVSALNGRHFPGLGGFFPESVSFISQETGFLWGSVGSSPHGVVARTTDGGKTWVRQHSPAVNDAFVSPHGDSQIRFATSSVGFVYGARNFITRDGGSTWNQYPAPGYIADLETVQRKIWALVRPCATCSAVRMFSATASNPTLRRVQQVPVMHGGSGAPEVASAASVAVSGAHVDVIVGSSGFWSTANGRDWKQREDPCAPKISSGPLQSAVVSSTTSAGVVVACGYDVNQDNETKRLFLSADSGTRWTPTLRAPSDIGYLQTLTADGASTIIVGTSRGGAQVSRDGGRTWSTDLPRGVPLSFVGYIDPGHIVAVADRAGSATGAFATSLDGGRNWALTSFP